MVPVAYIFPSKISNFSTVLKSDEDLHVFIIDDVSAKNVSIKDFFKAYGLRTRASSEYWLLDITSWANVTAAIEAFANLTVDVDDELYWYSIKGMEVSTENARQKWITLWEMYRKHENFPLSVVSTGNWSQVTTVVLSEDEKWIRRRNLTGVVFRIATLESMPYITRMDPIKGKEGFYTMQGMFAEVFFALQEIMNFSYTLQKPPDGNWGALQSDGSWTGMVKMLQNHQIDIGTTYIYM